MSRNKKLFKNKYLHIKDFVFFNCCADAFGLIKRRMPHAGDCSRIIMLLVALCGTAPPASAMGKLSEYTTAIFDCPGLSIGARGPRHSAINTSSMELVDICLYDLNVHRGIKLKIPAAYISIIYAEDRGGTAVNLNVWMPGFLPQSAVSELRDPDSKKRLQYLKENRKNQLQIMLSPSSNRAGFSEEYLQQFRNRHSWTTHPEWGLERYVDRCESLSDMKRHGRDISTRKCTTGDFDEAFAGRSEISKGMIHVQCHKHNEICRVSSRFEDMSMGFNILRTELHRIKEYEQWIDQFLRKYFVEKVPKAKP